MYVGIKTFSVLKIFNASARQRFNSIDGLFIFLFLQGGANIVIIQQSKSSFLCCFYFA